jgi:hypothetical protein
VLAQANADVCHVAGGCTNYGSPREQHSGLLPGHSGDSRQPGDRRATDNEVLFVDPGGQLVRQQTVAVAAPVQTIRPIVTEEPSTLGVNTFVRSLDNARYQLIEKKGDKEVYRDGETGTKWVVEVHQKGD